MIYISRFPRDATGMLHRQLENTESDTTVRIYAVGGDGILFDCINGAVDFPNIELVSVPYGRTNDYIRAFGEGKHSLFRNIGTLIDETNTIPTDLIYYGNNYAINFVSVGLESAAMFNMASAKKKYHKLIEKFPSLYSFIFFLSGLSNLFNQKLIFQHYVVTIDGKDFSGNYTSINIANGPCYGGNMCAVPTAIPTDGYLDVLLCKSQGTLKLLWYLQSYLYGKVSQEQVILKRAKKVSVRSETPLLIQMDGEMLSDSSITVDLIPKAIRMVALKGLRYEARRPPNA
jgi:YegS/Rv2252/BmrU family lipid kinase